MPLPSQSILDRFSPPSPLSFNPHIRLHHTNDIFSLWEAWEKETGHHCPVPFWAIVWPGAYCLGQYIHRFPQLVRGKNIVEIGCGGAAAAITAMVAGAVSVLCNDTDPHALAMAHKNAALNNVNIKSCTDDFSQSKLLPANTDLVFIADLFYEKKITNTFIPLIQAWKQKGIEVIIADGERPFTPLDFLEPFHHRDIAVNKDIEGVAARSVTLYRWK